MTLFVHTEDPTRSALRDPAVFEAAARAFPRGEAWLRLDAEPLSEVLATASLDNRWSALSDGRGPVVRGWYRSGRHHPHQPDAGTGHFADSVGGEPGGAHRAPGPGVGRVRRRLPRVGGADLEALVRLPGGRGRGDRERFATRAGRTGTAREVAALFDCALEDPEVMRARARVRHLVEPPERAYADPEIRARVARWLADRRTTRRTWPGRTGGSGRS
ncbi:hypothetical protein ACFSNO_24155 [Streptomyces cirratus]